MAARAVAAREGDVCAGVDGQAVVLVVDGGAGDGDAGGGADVEGVGVVAKGVGVAGGVVDGDLVELQVGCRVDGEALDGGVLDVEVLDDGVLQGVGVEESERDAISQCFNMDYIYRERERYLLGLGLASIAALAIPPGWTTTVDEMARSTGDGDLGSADADERTRPLLVSEGGGSLEGDGGSVIQARQVERGTGWNGNVVQDDGAARRLGLGDVGSGREGARSALLDIGGRGSGSKERQESRGDGERIHLDSC